jgi:hypothetical protein
MVQQTLDNPDLKTSLAQTYPSLDNFSVYPDFVNPFATYIAGVFFLIEGDYNRAVDMMKESTGMVGDNTYIVEDFAAVEQALNTGGAVPSTVWVVFENGLGPVKEEVRIDLPLFIATDNVRYFGIALPKLVDRYEALPHLGVTVDGIDYQTQLVTNMDAVVRTEFNKDFQGILTRAIISSTAKAIAQYSLEKNTSSGAAIVMALYSVASTAADVRIWTTLVTVGGGSMPVTMLDVNDCNHAIVYVRMIHGAAPAVIDVMKF